MCRVKTIFDMGLNRLHALPKINFSQGALDNSLSRSLMAGWGCLTMTPLIIWMVCILLLFVPILLITVHGRLFFNVVMVSCSGTTYLDLNWTLGRRVNDGLVEGRPHVHQLAHQQDFPQISWWDISHSIWVYQSNSPVSSVWFWETIFQQQSTFNGA